ncbi:MAG: hypothetical protein HKN58_03845 [Xanthomonadales bacterium]|nr:hypothetical protein [Xanthomonadales bacterium]
MTAFLLSLVFFFAGMAGLALALSGSRRSAGKGCAGGGCDRAGEQCVRD